MLRIGTFVLGVSDLGRATEFWSRALDYAPREAGTERWITLVPRDGRDGPALSLMASETPPRSHPRTHLDLYAADAAEQAAQVDRLVALGARRVDWDSYPDDPDFIVLADPDDNVFCVIDTSAG